VPVIEYGDFRLYEAQAILRYADRALPGPSLTPAHPQAAARLDQLMNINDWYLFQGVANVIAFQRIVGPRLLGLTPDEAAIVAAMPKGHAMFEELSDLLADPPYFAGDWICLAAILRHRRSTSCAPRPNGRRSWPQGKPCSGGWIGCSNAPACGRRRGSAWRRWHRAVDPATQEKEGSSGRAF